MVLFSLLSFEEFAEKVKKWLTDERLEIIDKPDQTTKLTFDVKSGMNVITLGFPKKSPDGLIVAGQIEFNQDEQNMLKHLKNRNEIMWDLQKFLT